MCFIFSGSLKIANIIEVDDFAAFRQPEKHFADFGATIIILS
ncbi:hypothetical protein [Alysiella filiformis]|nr:hypothetical protein [Alysiella filiformis]